MGRRQRWRRVGFIPRVNYFKPEEMIPTAIEEVNLLVDEAESIRLKDLEGLQQEECAQRMNVSRATFSRILDSARRKIADAILNGKALRIEGGNFEMAVRRFKCLNGHEWEIPFEKMISDPPEACPKCETMSIMPIFPEGSRWYGFRWRGPAWRNRR